MEYWRQKALNLFSTMYCVPLFQVTLVVFSVFTGAIFFSEFDELSTLYLIMFLVGVAVICVGVVILSVMTESRKKVPARLRLKAAFLAVYAACALKLAIQTGKAVDKDAKPVQEGESSTLSKQTLNRPASTDQLLEITEAKATEAGLPLSTDSVVFEVDQIVTELTSIRHEVDQIVAEEQL